jgi:N-acetylglutamate synthase-like GNAT family acetyltransferase
MNILIRLATEADIPAIQILIRESVSGLSSQFYSSRQIASALSHVFGVDSQLISDGTYYVASIEDRIVGAGGWSKRKALFGGDQLKSGVPDALLDPEQDAARIRAFYVHPAWARKGIGSRILQACEDAARTAGFSEIELVATLPGELLYLTKGYKKMEPVQIETPDGESLLTFRMTKTLSHG